MFVTSSVCESVVPKYFRRNLKSEMGHHRKIVNAFNLTVPRKLFERKDRLITLPKKHGGDHALMEVSRELDRC